MTKTSLVLCGASVLLSACTIRASAMIETEDAVYGNSKIEKVQKYDPKQHHLGIGESIMGAVNSDTIDALGRLVNGKSSVVELPPAEKSKSSVITPLPPDTPVLVEPK